MLSHIRLDEITEQDLLTLVENKVPESHTLEYKRETYKRNDKGKRELIKDIGAFANADGGDLIIGIEENDDGVAIALTGMSRAKISKEHERLEQIARSNFDPKIDFQTKEILLSNDEVILIFRIPASDIGPHRETFNGINRFHIRGSKTTDEPDVEGLRKMFLAPFMREQKIRELVDERIKLIAKGNGPVLLRSNDYLAIHIIPLRSQHLQFGYAPLTQQQLSQNFHPIRASSWSPRANLDGVLIHTNEDDGTLSYLQIFKNGTIEAVLSNIISTENDRITIPGELLQELFVKSTYDYNKILRELDIREPYIIFWSLHGVRGVRPVFLDAQHRVESAVPFDRDKIRIPEIQINGFSDIDDARKKLRPSLDTLWQSVGYDRCLYFDDNGDWNPPR